MKRMLKIVSYVFGIVIVVIVALISWGHIKLNQALSKVHTFPSTGVQAADGNVDTGGRIALIRNGCIHCHGLDFSGMVFLDDAMMGYIGGPNITPGRLSDWTDDEIARAIKYGVNRENKSLRFMPSMEYQYLSHEDIASVIAYLRSIPPSSNPPVEISFGPLAKILYGLDQIPNLAASNEFIQPNLKVTKPEEASTSEFGQYLVNSSCAGCHRMDLSGGTVPGAPPDWPPASPLNNLTQAGYNQAGFVQALRSGVKPSGQLIKPPMSEGTMRIMSDVELEAIWKYLASVEVQ